MCKGSDELGAIREASSGETALVLSTERPERHRRHSVEMGGEERQEGSRQRAANARGQDWSGSGGTAELHERRPLWLGYLKQAGERQERAGRGSRSQAGQAGALSVRSKVVRERTVNLPQGCAWRCHWSRAGEEGRGAGRKERMSPCTRVTADKQHGD